MCWIILTLHGLHTCYIDKWNTGRRLPSGTGCLGGAKLFALALSSLGNCLLDDAAFQASVSKSHLTFTRGGSKETKLKND